MNLLMNYDNINTDVLNKLSDVTSFNILSQITPPLSLKFKTKAV